MILPVILLTAVSLERLGELWLARRNTLQLLTNGGLEVAAGHYPLIVLLHGFWLGGLWVLGWNQDVSFVWLSIFMILQILRFWTLTTLGRRWTTRIIIVPGERLVVAGPYRFMRHPNYVVVIGEIAVFPLCLGMPLYALIFSIANAIILTIRIKAENAALLGLPRASAI